jgi:hypothetical protein
MSSEMVFRATLLGLMLGYIVPRSYYRRKARRASPEDQLPLKDTTESKVRLTLLGIYGLSADLLSITESHLLCPIHRGYGRPRILRLEDTANRGKQLVRQG